MPPSFSSVPVLEKGLRLAVPYLGLGFAWNNITDACNAASGEPRASERKEDDKVMLDEVA
jgi:hypothetical protein